MANDEGPGVCAVQLPEQPAEGSLLLGSAGVFGLTAGVQPALVANAYRVGVVVLAVGTNHELRTAKLYLSVTTDHVMVADAEVEAPLAMPGIDLSSRAVLVGPYCRTMDD